MRAFLYGLAWAIMLAAALGISLLARVAPNLLIFLFAFVLLSWLIAGAWVALGATAGTWPRPRTGQVLIVVGIIGVGINIWEGYFLPAAWSLLVLIGGVGFTFQIFPAKARRPAKSARVRPPLGRREEM